MKNYFLPSNDGMKVGRARAAAKRLCLALAFCLATGAGVAAEPPKAPVLYTGKTVAQWLTAMTDPDAKKRTQAIKTLPAKCMYAHIEPMAALVTATTDVEKDVRLAAWIRLSSSGYSVRKGEEDGLRLMWAERTPEVFTDTADVKFAVGLINLGTGKRKGRVTYTVTDIDGIEVAKGSKRITVEAKTIYLYDRQVKIKKKGIYYVRMDFVRKGREKKERNFKKFRFAVIDPLPENSRELNADSPFGMGVYIGRRQFADKPAELAYYAGVKNTRHEFSWIWIEMQQDQFTLGKNHNLELAHGYGMHILGMLGYSTMWSTRVRDPINPMGPPAKMEDYDDYVWHVVNEYKDKVKYWEIWNEPNQTTFWPPKPDPAVYAEMVEAGYKAAKRADPTCTVVAGATVWTDLKFIETIFKLGAFKHMDAVSVHPYRYPIAPDEPLGKHTASAVKWILEKIEPLREDGALDEALTAKEQTLFKAKVALVEEIGASVGRINSLRLTAEEFEAENKTLQALIENDPSMTALLKKLKDYEAQRKILRELMDEDPTVTAFIGLLKDYKLPLGVINWMLFRLKRDVNARLLDKTIAEELLELKKLIDKYGGGKDIWISELGWPTNTGPRGISEKKQAQYIIRFYVSAISVPTVASVQWYNFRNDVLDPGWTEANFGIVTSQMEPKAAYAAYATMTSQLGALKYHRRLEIGPRHRQLMAFSFKGKGPAETLVLWAVNRETDIELKVKDQKYTVIDMMGNASVHKAKKGVATLHLTESPIFIPNVRVHGWKIKATK